MGLPNDFRSSDPYLSSLMNDLIQSFMSLRFYIVGKGMLILEGNISNDVSTLQTSLTEILGHA